MTQSPLSSDPVEIEITDLRAEINRHTELYYQRSAPEISDFQFDKLLARLKQLEAEHPNQFVAIEPTSGEHFLADSFSNAVSASRSAHPDRIAFVIRIGHEAAIHF